MIVEAAAAVFDIAIALASAAVDVSAAVIAASVRPW